MASIETIIRLTDDISKQLVEIQGKVDNLAGAFKSLDDQTKFAENTMNKFNWDGFASKADAFGQKMSTFGTKMTMGVTVPLVMLGKKMYDTAVNYESAFADVRKTTNATEDQFTSLHGSFLEMSESKPLGFIDLSEIGYAGSQAGVIFDELETFVDVIADLQAATDIAGEEGVMSISKFLNLTEQSTGNIRRFGGSIVELGNNFSATENEILSMATNLAPAASLNNWNVPQILAISAAMVSMGINAEAGGTSAGKFMDQMSLAGEVGLDAMNRIMALEDHAFTGVFDVQKMMEQKGGAQALADELNVTKTSLDRMVSAWRDLDYFAKISGKTAVQFQSDWKANPAQSMLDFFAGLNALDESGMTSAIATLDEMGITEIRMARMIKGLTGNTALYSDALRMAEQAYAEDPFNNAMTREVNQRYETQASQNAMLGNKLENTMADLGDNVVKALQPALDTVNGLLDSFNNLNEVDQQRIVNALMGFAVIGPAAKIVGDFSSAIGSLARGLKWITQSESKIASSIRSIFTNSSLRTLTLGVGAVAGLVWYLNSIPSKTEQIISSLDGIKISIDQESLNKTKEDIASVQTMVDLLAGGAVTQEMEKLSLSVQMGFGTSSMYNKALAYEAQKVQADVERITSTYAAQIYDAEQQIINASTDAERSAGLALANSLKASMDSELVAARSGYTQTVSKLFNGMAVEISKQYPEMADKIAAVSSQYDLLSALFQYDNRSFDTDAFLKMGESERIAYEAEWDKNTRNMQNHILKLAANAGYLEGYTAEQAIEAVNREYAATPFATMMYGVMEQVETDLRDAYLGMNDNPVLANLFASILDNALLTENLDFTGLQGALDGVAKTLDFAQAAQKALDEGNANMYGQYLVLGLGQGVTDNAGLIAPSFTAVRDAALAALQAAFLMHSPSQLMAQQGVFIPMGLAQGILTGQSSVISAAIQVAQAGIRAAKAELGIASPSKVFEQLGIYTAEGYAMGVESGYTLVGRAVEGLFPDVDSHVWGLIDSFNGLELSDADMKSVRELAEKEVINRFTTPEIHVEFTAHNNINSKLDINEVMDEFGRAIEDALVASAEGVHI